MVQAPTHRMSLEEWAAMDEDAPGELVDGQLEEEEGTDYIHESTVAWLIQQLRSWAVRLGLGDAMPFSR
jgi:Uma2 family endonuclease